MENPKGCFEVTEEAAAFEASWKAEKHHVVFFGGENEVRWLKPGAAVLILDQVSSRKIRVQVSHVQRVTATRWVISFLHIHRHSGKTCCAALNDRLADYEEAPLG